MKKIGLFIITGLFLVITARAQENKNFPKQFEALVKAPLSGVLGELKTKDDYVYDSVYHSKMFLEGFEVSVGIKNPIAFVYAKYNGKGSSDSFDKILAQIKTLPYNFEVKTDNKSYEKEVEIKLKSTGKKVAAMVLDNFGSISIDFVSNL